jgi:hypothetical protein
MAAIYNNIELCIKAPEDDSTMHLTFPIESVKAYRTDGREWIVLNTSLPSPVWPFTDTLSIKIDVAVGHGVKYVKDVFGIDVEILES